MTDFEETAVVIEKEIEKLYNSKKFNQFICLCTVYHVNRCQNEKCINCNFLNELEHVYFENYPDEVNGTECLQNLCRVHFGSFFSLTCFLKSVAAIEREKIKLESKFNEILQIWNGNAPTKV